MNCATDSNALQAELFDALSNLLFAVDALGLAWLAGLPRPLQRSAVPGLTLPRQ
jgi:hypothetical protein